MDTTKNILWIVSILITSQLSSCDKGEQHRLPSETGQDAQTEVKVGKRMVTTDKATDDGTPVVPMWKAPMATTDLRSGAGFPVLSDAEHATVWQPASREDGAYNHYACLIKFKGKFFAMWGNHSLGEDAPGQRVLYAHADVWDNWSAPKELFPPPGPVKPRSEEGIHFKPDRWAIVDDVLYAITYVHEAGRYPIARSVSEDGSLGEPFLLTQVPDNGELPAFMQGATDPARPLPIGARLMQWYRENDQISWWADEKWGVRRKGADGSTLIECFMYRASDGKLVLMLRNWGTSGNPVHNNRMYVSFSDENRIWGPPYPTDIPDSPSRAQALTLEDGTVLLIGNQNVPYFDKALYLDRDPITVSVSKDGYTFDKVFALRTGSPEKFRIPDIGGRNPGFAYSSSIVSEGYLYTLYSIGKEDMGISRVSLSSIGVQ